MSYLNQYWFSINVLPVLGNTEVIAHKNIFSNCFYPIGNEVNGRLLCRVLADDFELIRATLNSLGKAVILCGGHDKDGYWITGIERNDAEFEKYMLSHDEIIDGVNTTITPADNTTAGRPEFRLGLTRVI